MGNREDWTSELIGLDGSLSTSCARARTSSATGCATGLWGERGVGKETLARLIAAWSGRSFFHLRASLLTAEQWRELATSDETPFRGGVAYLSEIESIGTRDSRRFAEAAASGRLNFQVVVGTSLSYESWRPSRTLGELTLATGYPIRLPALRERLSEAEALASRFFAEASRRLGVWRSPLTAEEVGKLSRACATGNLDELRARIERVVASDVFDDGLRADVEYDSSVVASATTVAPRESERRANEEAESESSTFLTLDEAMKSHIEEALRRSRGAVEGKRGAAAWLGINPYTLRARMRKLGIDWTLFRSDRDSDA